MMFTDWAWRAFVREFRKPEGITLLALAYISDMRLRAAMGTEGWWRTPDVAAITGLSTNRTRVHLLRLMDRGLVERQYQGTAKPSLWRMGEAAREGRAAVPRARAS